MTNIKQPSLFSAHAASLQFRNPGASLNGALQKHDFIKSHTMQSQNMISLNLISLREEKATCSHEPTCTTECHNGFASNAQFFSADFCY